MKKILKYPFVFLFFLFLLGYMIFDISVSNKEVSDLENRKLEQRPVFTLSSFRSEEHTSELQSR